MKKRHLLLVLLCFVFPLGSAASHAGDKQELSVIPVSRPVQREITDYADFTGRTDAVTQVEIRARVSGYLTKVASKEGSLARQGELPAPAPSPAPKATPKTGDAKPKPKDSALRDELLERVKKDQDARKAFMALMREQKKDDPAGLRKSDHPAVKRMQEIDRENTARLKAVVEQKGWPGKSLVGTDGAQAAWLLVQHADHDRPFQKQCLELIRAAFKKGEATGEQVAYLTDRVRVGEKQKQLYGTQLRVVNGKYEPQPIEDDGQVDERRKEMGMMPLAEYLRFAEQALEGKGKKKP